MATQGLRNRLGSPLYCGKIKVDFQALLGDFGGQMKTCHFWSNTREISFPDHEISDRLICHELIHAMYQENGFIKNCPILATEGLTAALAEEISHEPRPFLDPRYDGYYLNELEGLIQPDRSIPDNLILKNLYYSIAALFFKELIQIDATLVPGLFYDPPMKKTDWNNFMQSLVDRSGGSKKLIKFIDCCYVFHPLSQHLFAIPVQKGGASVRSVLLYIDKLAAVKQRTLTVITTIRDGSGADRRSMLLTFKAGVAETYLKSAVSGSVDFEIDLDNTHLQTVIPIN
jgi:hypothetical protein